MGSARVGVRDGLVAAGVAAILVAAGLAEARSPSGIDRLGYVVLALGGLALVARRRAPVAVLAFTGLCTVGYHAAGFAVFATAYLVAVYSAMRVGHRTATTVTSLIVLASLPAAVMITGGRGTGGAREVLPLAWVIAAAAAGEALRQAERRADEAERTREESARRRADEERLHIARELHDSLTHQISVIKIQAEAAVHVAQKRGEPVPEALLVIRDAGREASRELRATLEALRDDDRSPPFGLDQLPGLVRQAGAAGLRTSLSIEGERADVPAAVDRTGYRIVQESLTNVARHARAGTATVRVAYGPGAVVIQVDDDGTATWQSPPVPGVGLLGMRERVTALGGRLRAEPRREGGFTVHAELPVAGTP